MVESNKKAEEDIVFPAERIKSLREGKNISQLKLAKDLLIGQSTMSEYESGIKQPPVSVLINIADYFDVSLDYLTGRTDVKVPINKLNSRLTTRFGELTINDLFSLQDDEKEAILIHIQTYKKYKNLQNKKK
jgi:transcriptional regulator with XRE-family HTH domain